MAYRDSKACCHPIKVVRVIAHSHHLGNDCFAGPLDAKDLGKFLQVTGRSLTNGEDSVAKPTHAKATQLVIKELNTELACQQRDIFDDGQANSPLLVFGKLDDRRKKRL